jgi:hypothetical protein
MVVEEFETRHRGEFLRNGQFAGCGKAVDEDEFQRNALLCCFGARSFAV